MLTETRRRRGHTFAIVDIGGGFDSRFLVELSGATADDFARAAERQLGRVGYDFRLHVEPGRFVAADAGIGLTRVVAGKRNAERAWLICDLASNVLTPLPDIAYHPIPTLPANGEWRRFSVGDGTCAPTLICRDAVLPSGPEHRELALLNCGAYTTAFAELWAFHLPKILFIDDAGPTVVFGEEQYRSMMRTYYGYDIDL